MWIFTDRGFFSVVQKPGEDRLTVRARLEGDLERLREEFPTLGPTVVTPDADYLFRATISHADFAAGMHKMASEIGYSNFKDRVHDAQGREREWLYHSVWHVMNEAQEEARQDKR